MGNKTQSLRYKIDTKGMNEDLILDQNNTGQQYTYFKPNFTM